MPPPVVRLASSAATAFFERRGGILSKLVKDSRNNLCFESLVVKPRALLTTSYGDRHKAYLRRKSS